MIQKLCMRLPKAELLQISLYKHRFMRYTKYHNKLNNK